MPVDSKRVQSVFLAAADTPNPAARAAVLDRECGADAELRRRVEALLHAHDNPGSLLDQPAADLCATADAPVANMGDGAQGPEPGLEKQIGPYKLLEPIGEGGMGAVWLAEQQQPVRRRVALKVIKAGMDSAQVIARFEAERQALALMDHPHIAKVFDGDTTASGRPYFVMELVKGIPITAYCDEHRLTPRERLELFVPVCQAIQHAHQKGIIHRDIKPSNVLVAPYDGKPVVKVIDFGVAKAAGPQLTERTLFTGLGAVVGTLGYMSPEQAELNNQDIDTRSDVYSLGVLLYELLTGSTPLTRQHLKETPLPELLRRIREEEPPKPSTRLSEAKASLASVAAARQTEPAKLTKQVRGELDWIVMKALEKDRARRYETANDLARDVERYLKDEPVLAGPPSAAYRLRKFVRRHKGPVLGVSVIVLLLAAGTAGTTTGLVRAVTERNQKDKALQQVVKERDQKEEALRQVVTERDAKEKARREAVAAAEDEAKARRDAVTERDKKEEARRQTRQNLNALTDEVVEDLLGRQVQLTEQHRDFLKKVLAQHEAFAAADGDDPEGRQSRAEGYFRVGRIRHVLGQSEDAEAAYSAASALWKQLADDFHDRPEFRHNAASCLHNLGTMQRELGRPNEAETTYHKALDISKELVDAFPKRPEFRQQLTTCYFNLGILLFDTHRPLEAESAFDDALPLLTKLTDDFPERADYRRALALCHNERGIVLKDTQRPEKAEQAFNDALKLQKRLTDEFPNQPNYQQDLATTFNNLGVLLRAQERYAEAESAYGQALTIRKQLAAEFPARPDFFLSLAQSYNTMGNLLRLIKRPKEAEESYGNALAVYKRLTSDYPKRPNYHEQMARCYCNVGSFMRERQRPEDAEAAFGKALTLWEQLVKTFRPQLDFRKDLAGTYIDLGNLLRDAGRPKDAEAAYRKALPIQKELADEFSKRPEFRAELAQTYVCLGRVQLTRSPKDVESSWRDALAIQEKLAAEFPEDPGYQNALAGTLVNLACLHMERREFAAAVKLLEEARPHHEAALKANEKEPTYRQFYHNNLSNLARCYDALADHARLATTAEKRARFGYDLPGDIYDAASYLCHCVKFAGKDAQLDVAKRKELSNDYADRALALLQQAAERGYKDPARFPNRPQYRQELAQCYVQLGLTLNDIHRPKDAEALFKDARAIQEQLVTDFPQVPDYRNELAGTLVNLAFLHKQRREFDAAVKLLEEALPHHQAALKVNAKQPTYRQYYRNNLWNLAECRLGLADHARLAATADEFARFGYDPGNDTYSAAVFLCRCVTLADKDAQLDEAKRKELAQSYADRALALLQQAVARGFKDAAHMRKDPALEPLRAREEFRKLLADLEGKPKE
jgi:serine/threonine protein kinase/tetratricopeptide (TPR) repeat protein